MIEDDRISILSIFQTLKVKAARLLEPIVQAEGLTPLQTRVLLQLSQGDASLGDISGVTQMGQANASSLCKKLEKSGFLTRRRSCPDRRVVTLSLTEKGREATARIMLRMDRYVELINARPEEDREELIRGLRAVDQMLNYLNEQTKGDHDLC